MRRALGLALFLVLIAKPQARELAIKSPLSPRQSQGLVQLDAGLRLELVACETQIESPVAMAFDEDGRLWVVEMRDYPNGPAKGQPPEGRIRVLEDRDGDGFYEQSRVFADHLLFANGVMPWKGGALVTAAPHIVYLSDTDGDGKADLQEVLYEGFAEANPQLRVNHPVLGIDNWVYVANGLRGGLARRSGRPTAKPINLGGRDFCFDLVHDRAEAISGMGQYGNAFDDWGRRFVCDNHNHLRHIVLPERAIRRNPFLAVTKVLEDVSELAPGPLSSGGKIYPLSKNWTTSNLHAGRFTAACSVHIYRGDLLPAEYRGNAFTCDPTGNLIHREVLTPHGASFRSRPPREGVEFVASPEDWFRPVFLSEGPDGALYVVDMYRAVIEHPEFMPTELKQRPDLTRGKDRGRIWRIVPQKHTAKAVRPRLSHASTAELVKLLTHPGAWWRTTAQRLLLERQDHSAIGPLRELCSASESPQAILHAAWLLEAFGKLDEPTIARLCQHQHPRVREHAALLAESRLSQSALLQRHLTALASDEDARVRFQTTLALGAWDDASVVEPLGRIALGGADDPWTGAAVASSVRERAGELIDHLLREGLLSRPDPGRLELLHDLAVLVGARRDVAAVGRLLTAIQALTGDVGARGKMIALAGLADGIGRRGTRLQEFLKALPNTQRPAVEAAQAMLQQASGVATDNRHPLPERLTAVRLLAHAPWATAGVVLQRLVAEDTVPAVQLAAVQSLANHSEPEVGAALMKGWRGYTPALRREVTEAMLRQPQRVGFFLAELEAGRIKPGDLDAARIRQLVRHPRADLRDRARRLLQDSLPADRKVVLDRYRAALTTAGDAARGKGVFQKNCSTCHQVAGVGVEVGPDVSDTRTKTPAALLEDILNPNRAIDNNYINYLITTKNGTVLSGMIAVETASGLTLRRAENQTEVVLRRDIDEIQSTGQSLMPEGLEKNITVAEMADLLAFLKNWRYLDGAVPLGGAAK